MISVREQLERRARTRRETRERHSFGARAASPEPLHHVALLAQRRGAAARPSGEPDAPAHRAA